MKMGSSNIFMQAFRWTYRIVAVTLNNLYCIPTYVIWCVLLHPIYMWNPEWYWMIEGQFFQWLLTMVAYWSYSAGYYIVETGDLIDSLINDETLVLVNHQSTSDVPLLMHAFSSRNGLLQKLNWIMDAVFQYTNFGVVSTLHGDFFINAGRDRRDASLRDLDTYLKHTFVPRKRKWLVLFPEGGFLRKRKEASKRYAAKMNLPNLEYVTLPRMGALQTIINVLAPPKPENADVNQADGANRIVRDGRLKYIIDMTIAYPDGEPLDLGTIITGYVPSCKVHMHYKLYHIDEVPHNDPEELKTWLNNIYIEKNNLLGHYYKTGVWNPEWSKINIEDIRKLELNHADANCNPINEAPGPDVVEEARNNPSNVVLNDGSVANSIPLNEKPKVEKSNAELQHNNSVEKLPDNGCVFEPLTEEEYEENNHKILHLDLLRITILHVMFISSTWVHWTAFRSLFYYFYGDNA